MIDDLIDLHYLLKQTIHFNNILRLFDINPNFIIIIMIRNLNKIVTIKFIHIKQFQLKKSSSRIYILAPISARKDKKMNIENKKT